MIFDSHAHYDDEKFDGDRHELIEDVHNQGIEYILNASSDIESSKSSVSISEKFSFVFAAVGIHPHNAQSADKASLEVLKDLASNKKVKAIGEIGLDYYYDYSPKEIQKIYFAEQIRLARQLKLPVVIHDRDAHEDVLKLIIEEKAKDVGGVFHCYTGSLEMARIILDNNFYISFGGPITFKNAKKALDVVKFVPENRILAETDCPYLAPEPCRGHRNHSGYLKYIIAKIAEVRGLTFDKAADITMVNAATLFNIG